MSTAVLVTGAAGFIGLSAARTLSQSGMKIGAGVRQPSSFKEPGIPVVTCDLDAPDQVSQAVADSDAVVHCAYGSDALMAVQCQTLLEAMSKNRVSKLVYTSSIAVYGDQLQPDSSEIANPDMVFDAYAKGKAACEKLIEKWVSGSNDRKAIILRPGIVYGSGSYFWIDKTVQRIEAGVWGDFGPIGAGQAALIYVDDVARAIQAAIERLGHQETERPPLEAFDLVGPETPAWNDYFAAVASAIGKDPLPKIGPLKLTVLRVLGLVAKSWRKLGLPGGTRLFLTPAEGELKLFARTVAYDRQRTEAALGVEASIGLKDGLDKTFNQVRSTS